MVDERAIPCSFPMNALFKYSTTDDNVTTNETLEE